MSKENEIVRPKQPFDRMSDCLQFPECACPAGVCERHAQRSPAVGTIWRPEVGKPAWYAASKQWCLVQTIYTTDCGDMGNCRVISADGDAGIVNNWQLKAGPNPETSQVPFWTPIVERAPDIDAGSILAARTGTHPFIEMVAAREVVHYTEQAKKLNEEPIWHLWAPIPALPQMGPAQGPKSE